LTSYDVITNKFRLILRYDALRLDRHSAGNLLETVTAGFVWSFVRRTKILLNYEWRNDRLEDAKFGTFLAQFQAAF